MADTSAFTKLVPGFDFLQDLVKNAGAALPTMGQWIAPTLNPEELDKRIEELRTVQFWLEQNARMLGATIQALEVQRMTLSTLKTMNVQMGELRDAMKLRMPGQADDEPETSTAPTPPSQGTFARTPPPAPRPSASKNEPDEAAATDPADTPTAAPAPGVVDPMQWWNALTQQFTALAADAARQTAHAARTTAASVSPAGTAAPSKKTPAGRKAATPSSPTHARQAGTRTTTSGKPAARAPAKPPRAARSSKPR